jgi:hypothetical protein
VRADFNGDGFQDLAIGVPGQTVGGDLGAGAVSVIYGTADGLSSVNNQFWSQDRLGTDPSEPATASAVPSPPGTSTATVSPTSPSGCPPRISSVAVSTPPTRARCISSSAHPTV